MATLVGTQDKFVDALISLAELDIAAAKAYEEAITHLKSQDYKQALQKFKEDHERHVRELSDLLRELGEKPPASGGVKELFTQGKVVFANLLSDEAILRAMNSNEDDTNTAYERMSSHKGKTDKAEAILKQGLEDERKHRTWIETTLARYK